MIIVTRKISKHFFDLLVLNWRSQQIIKRNFIYFEASNDWNKFEFLADFKDDFCEEKLRRGGEKSSPATKQIKESSILVVLWGKRSQKFCWKIPISKISFLFITKTIISNQISFLLSSVQFSSNKKKLFSFSFGLPPISHTPNVKLKLETKTQKERATRPEKWWKLLFFHKSTQ